MKRRVPWLMCGGMVCLVGLIAVKHALAVPQFKQQFDKLYVKQDATTDEEKTLAAAVGQAKCNVCHKGNNRKSRNAYGQALDKLLNKKTDAKNPEKIISALHEVESQHSKPGEDSSPTFGELIKQGKLPGGDSGLAPVNNRK